MPWSAGSRYGNETVAAAGLRRIRQPDRAGRDRRFEPCAAAGLRPLRPTGGQGMEDMAGAGRETVEVFNVNHPGRSSHVDARKYGEMKRALLELLPADEPGMTQAQMIAGIPALLSAAIFPGGETAGWWLKTVQLDLEARGMLERSRDTPNRWRRRDAGTTLPVRGDEGSGVPAGPVQSMPGRDTGAVRRSGRPGPERSIPGTPSGYSESPGAHGRRDGPETCRTMEGP
jgi:hypothetical protein